MFKPMRAVLTVTAARHHGSCSACAACSPLASLSSLLQRTTELWVRQRGGLRLQWLVLSVLEQTTAVEISYVCFFLLNLFQKLTSASMQSESGIVPDFEVGEEFQEEPKTYYELKSQPLKNRSVLCLWTVISQGEAVLVFR